MGKVMLVWSEIAVGDLDRGKAFYDGVFGWTSVLDKTSGPEPMVVLDGSYDAIGGNLYEGSGGAGPRLHFALPDTVEAGQGRLTALGGTVEGPVVEIPPGRFVFARDPWGNPLGLFQPRQA